MNGRAAPRAAPPPHWGPAKIASYRDEAVLTAERLGYASTALAARLRARIARCAGTASRRI